MLRPHGWGARHRSGREGSPNRSRDREGALLALPIDLTLPHGRGSDWSTPYARILSIGRHLRKALSYVSRTPRLGPTRRNGRFDVQSMLAKMTREELRLSRLTSHNGDTG